MPFTLHGTPVHNDGCQGQMCMNRSIWTSPLQPQLAIFGPIQLHAWVYKSWHTCRWSPSLQTIYLNTLFITGSVLSPWSCTSSLTKMHPNRSSKCRFGFKQQKSINFRSGLLTVYAIPMPERKVQWPKHDKGTLHKLWMWLDICLWLWWGLKLWVGVWWFGSWYKAFKSYRSCIPTKATHSFMLLVIVMFMVSCCVFRCKH